MSSFNLVLQDQMLDFAKKIAAEMSAEIFLVTPVFKR